MLSTLRGICCCSKEQNDDGDVQDNSRPVSLSKPEGYAGSLQGAQRQHHDRSDVALTPKVDHAVHTGGPSYAKPHDSGQQKKDKPIQPAEQDEPCLGESSTNKRNSKEGGSRPLDNGPKPSNEIQDGDSKEPAVKTSNLPNSEPTIGEVINGSLTPDKKDLWQRAFDELDDDSKTFLNLHRGEPKSPEPAIQEVIARTKEAFQEYQNAALKFKKYQGEEINVRDVAGKILNSAIHCSEIIKGVAALDPSGHAASAWGIVSFGLMMTKNNMEQKEAVFESSGFLAEILARYTVLDHHCRIQGLPSSDGLDSAIVQVYKALLEYSAEVERQQSAGKLDRMMNSIFSVSDTDLARLQSVVEEQDRKVSNWSQITHVLHQNTKAVEILAGIESLGRDTEVIKVKVLEGERQRILDWLSDINFSKFQNESKILRTEGTGNWLLDSSEYRDWKAKPGKFLWLHGPAGCGKSVLCSTVIRDIEETRSAEPAVFFSYWYFQHDNKETQDVQAMTRAIIRQLVAQEFPKSLISLWEEQKEHNREPDQDKVLAVLGDVIECHTGDDIFLIFDALDECSEMRSRERCLLFRVLKYLRDDHGKNIHLVATSRFEDSICCHMTGSLGIDLEQRMHEDVEAFVCDSLVNGTLNHWKDVHVEIKESLEECKKKDEVLELLKLIPETLEGTYRGILEKIRGHKRKNEWKDARSILTWLSFSLEPLSLEEVAAVVSYDRPEDVVTTCTTSLVTVSPSDGTIKLAHFSVKEFLVTSDAVQSKDWYQLTTIDGYFDITNCALDILLKETDRDSVCDKPLFQYAATHWHEHFSELVGSGHRLLGKLEDKVISLFQRPIVYLNWQRSMEGYFDMTLWGTSDSDSEVVEPPLYSACVMGLQSVVETLLSQGADPIVPVYNWEKSDKNADAFDAAALYGHLTIIKHLLESFSISAEKAQTIMEDIDLTDASPNDIGAFLDILLRSDLFYDVSANACPVLKEDFVFLLLSDVLKKWHGTPDRARKHCKYFAIKDQKQSTQEIVHEFLNKQGLRALELLSKLPDVEIKVTEELLVAAAFNRKGAGALGWLLERAPPIEVTSTILRNILWSIYATEKLDVLITKCQRPFRLDEEVLQDVVKKHYNVNLMRVLLQKREEALTSFDLSNTILTVVTSGLYCSKEMMDLLIDNTNSLISVSEEFLCSAARNTTYGASVMKWLLPQGISVSITEELLVSAVGNQFQGKDILEYLRELKQDLRITEKVWLSAVANGLQGESILRDLLELDKNRLITEEILISAVNNEAQGPSILRYLLKHGKQLDITENVLVSAAGNCFQAEQVLGFIFINFPNVEVTNRVLEAAGGVMPISVLLRHIRRHGQDYSVTLMKYASSNCSRMKELLEKRLIEVDNDLIAAMGTQKVLRTALGDSHIITKLLDSQRDDIAVTEEIIMEALDEVQVDYKAFKILCNRQSLTELDTTKILRAALLNNQFEVSDALLKEGRHENLQRLWDSICQADRCLPSDIVRSASHLLNYGDFDVFPALQETLIGDIFSYHLKYDDDLLSGLAKLFTAQNLSASVRETITEIIVEKADARGLHRLFIDLVNSGTLISVEAWDAVWRNHRLNLAQKAEISKFLLCYGEFDVSQTLLEFLSLEDEEEGFTDEDINQLFNLSAGREISPPVTATLAKLVFGRGNAYTIQRFIHHNPTVQLTDEYLQLVKRNEIADKDVLMCFFRSKGVPIDTCLIFHQSFVTYLTFILDSEYIVAGGKNPSQTFDLATGGILCIIREGIDSAAGEPYVSNAALKKVRVWIQGCVHGNEPAGDEATQALLGKFVDDAEWAASILKNVELVILPWYNPNSMFYFQHMLALNFDPNHNHIKLAWQQTREIKQIINKFDLHVIANMHEYSIFLIPMIHVLLEDLFMKNIADNMQAMGLHAGPYMIGLSVSNSFMAADFAKAGMMCGIGIADQKFQRRTAAGLMMLGSIVQTAADNAETVFKIVKDGINKFILLTNNIVVTDYSKIETCPFTMVDRANGSVVHPPVRFASTMSSLANLTRARPEAYFIPVAWSDLAERLREAGCKAETLDSPFEGTVETLTITSAELDTSYYEGVIRVTTTTESSERTISLPEGSFLVRTRQKNAALVMVALEPENIDSYVSFNILPVEAGDSIQFLGILG
ncbi:uncharacterized protein BDV14DRAFT_196758 [Aspergillus stella-maris]|uniref:uncharacterized protein n=1 Tax=Aspergillus stella-maris TaxID=1810926 RepID=UPI003CCE38E7